MTVIVYKCPVCDRTIDIVQNEKGLETVGRCVITDGCRGKLYQLSVKQDFTRGEYPSAVAGLIDWSQRKVLYDHTQTVADSQWLIQHDLGVSPSVQVFIEVPVSGGTELEETTPDSIVVVDENNIIINLSRNESGVAQCVGRNSKPVITNVRVEETRTETEPFQFSGNSEITIATIDTTTNIDLVLSFTTPDGRIVDLTYTVDNVPSITSPWSDTDKIFFHEKSYIVRSFSGIDQVSITDGTVQDSSSFYIKSINVGSGARSLVSEEIIILLADSPYTEVDKRRSSFVDPTLIGADEASFSFYYENGEFLVYDNLIETVFPPIRSI